MATAIRFFRLLHDGARQGVAEFAQRAPEGTEVVFRKPSRSSGQNDLFHALCDRIAKSGMAWHKKRRGAAEWKTLLVSGHTVATQGMDPDLTMGLEGELVSLRESTAQMDKARTTSLIEYTLAFMAENGIRTDDGPPSANAPNYTAPSRRTENTR